MANAKSSSSKSNNKRFQGGISAVLHVQSTRNNTIVTLSDARGNVICKSSGGRTEKGARKRTAHAAKQAGHEVGTSVKNMKIKVSDVKVMLRGVGSGRETAILGFNEACNAHIKLVRDITPKAFAGVRKRKQKRI